MPGAASDDELTRLTDLRDRWLQAFLLYDPSPMARKACQDLLLWGNRSGEAWLPKLLVQAQDALTDYLSRTDGQPTGNAA